MKKPLANRLQGLGKLALTLSLIYIAGASCNIDSKAGIPSHLSDAAGAAVPVEPTPAETPSGKPADAATILARVEIPILCYHQVRSYKPNDSPTAKAYIVPEEVFAAQMKSLSDSGYHAILPNQLYDYLVFGKALPAKPVMITFDDTRLDQYTAALPELNKYKYKGAFFIMTVSLGRPGYMSREQVKQLSDEGHAIGSHTWNHNNVKKYEGEDWVTQVEKPARVLSEIIGKPVEHFAYPFGLWNKEGIPHLKEKGMKTAFQLYAPRDENDPLYSIRRIIVPGSWSVSSLHHAMTKNFK